MRSILPPLTRHAVGVERWPNVRRNGRESRQTVSGGTRKRALFRGVAVAIVYVAFVAGVQIGGAAENVLERDDIQITYEELNKIITDLEGAITTAENALGNVRSMAIEEGSTAADLLFGELKARVNGMLDGLAPNSVLVDNLEGAKANVIVLKRWFERQPPDYPNRDQLIIRVEETIQNYGELTDLVLAGRQDAQDALRELLRAQFYQSMELKVESAELSVEVTKRLVTSLRGLSTKIRQVAEQEIPSPIPN